MLLINIIAMKKNTKSTLFAIVSVMMLSATLISCDKVNLNKQQREDIILTKSQQNIVRQSNNFSINVLREMFLLQGNNNICVSPLSASIAISAISCGAQGNTLDQIQSVLGFSNISSEEMNDYFKYIIPQLQKVDKSIDFLSANAVWTNNGFDVYPEFVSKLDKYYSSKVSSLDFSSDDAVKTINKWCKEKTKGLIPKIIEGIDPNSKLMLANALYFKGEWQKKFNKKDGVKETFYNSDGSIQGDVAYMCNSTLPIRYGESEETRVAAIPYGNGAYEMVIVLPNIRNGFLSAEKLLTSLDGDQWEKWMSSLGAGREAFDVKLPSFKVEYDSEDYMKEALIKLGMIDAFNADAANFSGISNESLYISLLKQKTFIDVNEEGTEAAAVTVIGMKNGVDGDAFHVNRPFIYAIREVSTGATLFIGLTNRI